MIFTEKKNQNNYEYRTEDFLGEVILRSKEKIEPEILDSCVLRLFKGDLEKGEIVAGDKIINFEFNKKSQWLDDE